MDPELLEEINRKLPTRVSNLIEENKVALKNWNRRETNRHLIISSAERLKRESCLIRKARVEEKAAAAAKYSLVRWDIYRFNLD